MATYEAKIFNIPSLEGISDESVKQHIALYEGYVKNFNAISAKIAAYAKESTETHALALGELVRRKSFEFDGMRLHEYYFPQFAGGAKPLNQDSVLGKALSSEYHGYFVEYMKAIANMRGPGWAVCYWDSETKPARTTDGVQSGGQFQTGFIGEQHQGLFATLPIILALDVWEHAFLLDHGATGKAKYIDAFFANLNWSVIEERFSALQ